VLGISFGPQIQVYYLIAMYCFVCTALMFALTRTPLGRMLNAVRDNPERVEFIGYRHAARALPGLHDLGLLRRHCRRLAALNFEIVTAEVVGAARSGAYLLFTFLGGATFFFGPIIGAVLMVLALVLLSELTKAWLLYLGLIFLFHGDVRARRHLASLIMMNLRVAAFGKLRGCWPYLALAGTGWRRWWARRHDRDGLPPAAQPGAGPELKFMGATLDTKAWTAGSARSSCCWWARALFELVRRAFARSWGEDPGRDREAKSSAGRPP
jgi:branched-chain amino acid transport system permease protein